MIPNSPPRIQKRGIVGWFFLLIFVAFNVFMAWAMLSGIFNVSQLPIRDEAEEADQAVFGIIGVGTVLLIWLSGAAVLGLFAILTRGRETNGDENGRD